MAEKLNSRVDQYGFEKDEEFDHATYNEVMSDYLPVLAKRSARWFNTYGDVSLVPRSTRLKRFCRKGVPHEWRALMWYHFSGAASRRQTYPDLYRRLLDKKDHDPTVIDSINLDLHRTFPDNIYYAEKCDKDCLQQPLYRILVATAQRNQHIGYCQGLNFIVGMILLIVKDEERCFWILDCLINSILPDYYNPNMIEIQAEQRFLGELVKWKCPLVSSHLEKQGVSWMLVSTKWFICIFADVLPTETCLRLWDCLFYEGVKILYRAALTLVLRNQTAILSSETFADIVRTFKTTVTSRQALTCHQFMQDIFTLPGSFPNSTLYKIRQRCVLEETESRQK